MKENNANTKVAKTKEIFENEEMTRLLQAVIEKGVEGNYHRAVVARALVEKWSELYPLPQKVYDELSDDERAFEKKAKKFIHDYSDELIEVYKKHVSSNVTNISYALNMICTYMRAAYCAFSRDSSITKVSIEDYAEHVINQNISGVSELARAVDMLIFFQIRFDENTYMPSERGSLGLLLDIPSREEFISKHRFKSTRLAKNVINMVWFVTTYY